MFRLFIIMVVLILLTQSSSLWAKNSVVDNPVIVNFIDSMVKKHQFDKQKLTMLFADVKVMPEIIERMSRPAEALPWHKYRKIFVKQKRIDQGVQYWQENEKILAKAEQKFGVPAEIIVAILGVETRYGRNKGGFRLIDSLTTLVLDYPKRSEFFAKELEQTLLLARDEGFDPRDLVGS